MKLSFSNQKSSAITFVEVLVVVACLLVLALLILMFLPMDPARRPRAARIECVSNLKQINLAFRIWEGDNGNQYPMAVSVTNGGGREFIEKGDLAAFLQVASNELGSTKILVCPADPKRTFATNWNDLDGSNISYFFGADVRNEDNTNLVLEGGDNLIVSGAAVKSGMLELSSNAPVSWSGTRHKFCGNIGFADGTVVEGSSNGLEAAFQGTGLANNRIVIP